ncbi:MAG: hypothetical protein ABMA25_08750 [Ilumatobacteraceae bacterium]
MQSNQRDGLSETPVDQKATGSVPSAVATGAVALLMTAALAYGTAWTLVLFDGMSAHAMDGGNSFGYGIVFVLSIPVWLTVSCCLCFWTLHRFGFRPVLLLLVPFAVWGMALAFRYTAADCGDALSRC